MQTFQSFEGCLELGLELAPRGTALEFGVAGGRTLRKIVAGTPSGSRVVGFDSFQGLPEDWREGFAAGTFRTTPPDVPGAELIVGLYATTLPDWQVPDDIVLVHIDCDLYSSTRTVLDHIGPRLQPGCLIVFDEFHGYPGAEDHEAKAWSEWAEASGTSWSVLGQGPEQLLVRIEGGVSEAGLVESSHAPRGYDRQPGPAARGETS